LTTEQEKAGGKFMTKRVGLLGGTFDPVHYGHLLVAESCREQLQLDQVRFIPAAKPPHKLGDTITDGQARADMLALAVAGCPEFVIDRRELKRIGPSFTMDTLSELVTENPSAEFFLLMGADSLRDFLTWKNPQRIAKLATLVACNRPGISLPAASQIVEWVGPEIAERVISVAIPGTDLAATDLRRRAAEGRSLRFRTPRAVEAYIAQHRLYAAGPTAPK
jgi:nicotinate-nucleotide adenylyltransferase